MTFDYSKDLIKGLFTKGMGRWRNSKGWCSMLGPVILKLTAPDRKGVGEGAVIGTWKACR